MKSYILSKDLKEVRALAISMYLGKEHAMEREQQVEKVEGVFKEEQGRKDVGKFKSRRLKEWGDPAGP